MQLDGVTLFDGSVKEFQWNESDVAISISASFGQLTKTAAPSALLEMLASAAAKRTRQGSAPAEADPAPPEVEEQ